MSDLALVHCWSSLLSDHRIVYCSLSRSLSTARGLEQQVKRLLAAERMSRLVSAAAKDITDCKAPRYLYKASGTTGFIRDSCEQALAKGPLNELPGGVGQRDDDAADPKNKKEDNNAEEVYRYCSGSSIQREKLLSPDDSGNVGKIAKRYQRHDKE